MPNALAQESSPYLRQHADNPVDWLPWSQQALDLAREQNRPILLSIGYSACHWCHVMAHESFEDEATAALMNRHFVNIKVDREERPDIDRIYQVAHQLIARRPGGWPLTMFLSPDDQLPFFGGTYFPDKPRHGMIAFADLLERIATIYRDQPEKIRQQGQAIQQALIEIEIGENQNQRGADIDAANTFDAQLLAAHDSEFGGFGRAPKFPQPAILLQAINRAFRKTPEDPVYRAIDVSLRRIALGGIQDHVGGGFYRYSVDEKWMIPHFEKMLYDNGQLLQVFAQAYRLTADPLYRDAVDSTAGWLAREMRSPSGAFYAALDADSEGVEGKFYLWSPDEVRTLIGADAYEAFAWRFGLDQAANFEGRWHLHGYRDRQQVIDRFGLDGDAYDSQHEQARRQLLAARERRMRPGLDDKVLTSWNALVIRGLATAARVFMRDDYYDLARRCLQAMQGECWRDGRLLAQSASSGKRLPAYLDDYAHLLQACLDCLQYEWQDALLDFAIRLADKLQELFEDRDYGGFFFTAIDHEKLIQRPKSWPDEAMPSGNAVAALALLHLGLLVGNRAYTQSAERALQSVADNVNQAPLHAAGFVALLEAVNRPPTQLIVRGEPDALAPWRARILPRLQPQQTAFFIPSNAGDLPEEIAQKHSKGATTAWICEGFSCRAPLQDIYAVLAALESVDP
ncbi:MAG: thioredoxin domain-containing protein [Gammaproteobacteria bacterium]|nr:thioredoxin domain-containing protein [Gammaproteobacteria bacterium]MDH3534339.1 thioredoxin domain-containing protein [Gammaproteobacteria bacterium]